MTKFSWTGKVATGSSVVVHLNSYAYAAKLTSESGSDIWHLYIKDDYKQSYEGLPEGKIAAERYFLSEKPFTYFWERLKQKGIFRKLAFPVKAELFEMETASHYTASLTMRWILAERWFNERHCLTKQDEWKFRLHIQTVVKAALGSVKDKGYTLAAIAPRCIYMFSPCITDPKATVINIMVDVNVCHQWDRVSADSVFRIRVFEDGLGTNTALVHL